MQWQAPAADEKDNEVIEFSWAGETARHVGTVVHRWLQRLADDALDGWTPARIETMRPRLARELERRGVRPAECADAAARVARALVQTLQDERGRWLLGPRTDARSEYRVRRVVGNVLHSYVMDRVFRDDTGTRWIVDYKTSSHEGGDVRSVSRSRARALRTRSLHATPRRSANRRRSWDCISRCSRVGASGSKRLSRAAVMSSSARVSPGQAERMRTFTDLGPAARYDVTAGVARKRRCHLTHVKSNNQMHGEGKAVDILEVIRNRRSDRHFDGRPVAQRGHRSFDRSVSLGAVVDQPPAVAADFCDER